VEVNKGLYRDLKRGMFVTAVLANFDPKNDTVQFANAGHNPPLYWDERAGQATFLETHGMALGMSEGQRFASSLGDVETKLRKGDMMAFYTDGVVEAMNTEGVEFGTDPLVIAAQMVRMDSAERLVQRIVTAIERHAAGAEQSDDITLFVMKR
jgi:sigma-B regulation protein RsbU (phosphoserine phosphatase)